MLEHHFIVHDHEADDPLARLGKALDRVAKAVVADDVRLELFRERQDEIVGVGAGGCLLHGALLDESLVSRGVVDLVPQRGIGDDDRLQTFLDQLVADEENVLEPSPLAFGEVRDVRCVDERRFGRRLAARRRPRAGAPSRS